ncbi:unnamed protein product [Amoebophrya sp. A25]|nr:unnamed protein product [Amoebophrya sp. A25]|eukprot:GSA25T00002446001.1
MRSIANPINTNVRYLVYWRPHLFCRNRYYYRIFLHYIVRRVQHESLNMY